ncbi:LapA family protein [Iningainema tapete]|uniref:LapA family protein n=1 Tax=Iningainema tapete BLCC-T55 TaxID=2748662 RepID=A0A8J7BXU3_9CYAN|nr:LapA family protein [Iningainema tapete]MBD2773478.1 LapA family protein [Iningainema tapete BLCC-T55]
MNVIRLFLLLAVLGGLTLLLVQNLSPVISLTFLGVKTSALPLASWILFSTGAGIFTSLLITSLFNLSNYFTRQTQNTPRKAATTYTSATSGRKETKRPEPPPSNVADDDWDQDSSKDDWDVEEKDEPIKDRATIYERQQEPKSVSQSGSVYSYSYQEPKNSGVRKTESVYDADYRVIVPPHQPSTTNKADDDDWGFLDEDLDDLEPRDRSKST